MNGGGSLSIVCFVSSHCTSNCFTVISCLNGELSFPPVPRACPAIASSADSCVTSEPPSCCVRPTMFPSPHILRGPVMVSSSRWKCSVCFSWSPSLLHGVSWSNHSVQRHFILWVSVGNNSSRAPKAIPTTCVFMLIFSMPWKNFIARQILSNSIGRPTHLLPS